MKDRKLILGSLIAVGLLSLPAKSQVLPLGQVSSNGGVTHASCDCGSCGGGGGLWGAYGPGGGGSCRSPSCGSSGLGYAGSFGDCESCGTGGYFGRNIYPVESCACGGSLIADLFFGVKRLVCCTMSGLADSICGGLQSASCHASGSFAALRCASQCMSCSSCGSADCDGGMCGAPACGVDGYISEGTETYLPYDSSMPMQPQPATESMPSPAKRPASADPFTDDPAAPLPQESRLRRPAAGGVRYYTPRSGNQVRTTSYQPSPPQSGNMIGTAVQNALQSVKIQRPTLSAQRSYLPQKSVMIRR